MNHVHPASVVEEGGQTPTARSALPRLLGKDHEVRLLPSVRSFVRTGAVAFLGMAAALVGSWGERIDTLDLFAWPAAGVGCTALVLVDIALWPGVAVGAFLAALAMGFTTSVAALCTVINVAQTCAIAALLPHLGWRSIHRLKDTSVFLGVVIFVTTMGVSAGTAGLIAVGGFPADAFGSVWRSWWSGDIAGGIIVTAFVRAWHEPLLADRPVRPLHVAAVSCFAVGAFLVVFGALEPVHVTLLGLPGLWFVAVVLTGARFAQRGAVTVMLFLLIAATIGTALGRGPFVDGGGHQGLAGASAFLALLAASGLLVGAAVAERDAQTRTLERINVELREALHGRDTFLSVASHELRTPLGALMLQLELLLHGKDTGLDGLLHDKLTRAHRQVRRMKHLVDRLFDLSKIRNGSLEMHQERLDLAELVRDVAARFESDLLRVGSPLQVRVPGPVWGEWDGGRLEQVLSNLVVNAAKYGKGAPVELELRVEGGFAVVSVRDHGIGIAPEDQARIFSRFERLTPEHNGAGLGLGLWICDQLITAMGGVIRVASAPSQGSVFTVELPLSSGSGGTGAAVPAADGSSASPAAQDSIGR